MTVGTDLDVHVFGTSASSALDDVKINATLEIDSTDHACGEEDLTVIWIDANDVTFRGSAQQGDALTAGSTAKHSTFDTWLEDKVGKFIYHKPGTTTWDAARWQMEIKYQVTPNVVISGVEWDIKREASGVHWGPGTDPLTPIYKGKTDWDDDDPGELDEDLIQNDNLTQLFEVDAPGYGHSSAGLNYTAGHRCTMKAKFQDWMEIKIGSNWYVCSKYKNWRTIMHVKYQDATAGWVEDTTKTNEVVEDHGPLTGFSGTWSEN